MRVKPRYQILKPLLTALLVMAFAVPSAFARVGVTWFCEGRACGYTAFFCCCTAPVGRDPQCSPATDRVSPLAGNGDQTLCAAQCDCRMVIGTSDGPLAKADAAVSAPVHPTLVALPPSEPLVAPAPFVRPHFVAPMEARGPPPASRFASAPSSPRAPPFS